MRESLYINQTEVHRITLDKVAFDITSYEVCLKTHDNTRWRKQVSYSFASKEKALEKFKELTR